MQFKAREVRVARVLPSISTSGGWKPQTLYSGGWKPPPRRIGGWERQTRRTVGTGGDTLRRGLEAPATTLHNGGWKRPPRRCTTGAGSARHDVAQRGLEAPATTHIGGWKRPSPGSLCPVRRELPAVEGRVKMGRCGLAPHPAVLQSFCDLIYLRVCSHLPFGNPDGLLLPICIRKRRLFQKLEAAGCACIGRGADGVGSIDHHGGRTSDWFRVGRDADSDSARL